MKTSAFAIPPNSIFIRQFDWQMKALDNAPAATVMSIMMYHYDNRMANKLLSDLIDNAVRHQRPFIPLGDWMPYSVSYLEKLMLGTASAVTIRKALKILVSKGFVFDNVPEHITELYSRNMNWYRISVEAVNGWIEQNCNRNAVTVPVEKPPASQKFDIEIKTVFEFYRHIHDKKASYILDDKRRALIRGQLKAGRTVGQMGQAIIGNLCSDFHQGRHPDNMVGQTNSKGVAGKVFDDLDNILRDAKRFEMHIGYAEEKGVTEETALAEVEQFLLGNGSKWAKKQQTKGPEPVKLPKLSQLEQGLVNAIADRIYFMFAEMQIGTILSECLNQKIATTPYPKHLAAAIVSKIKLLMPDKLTPGVEQKIKNFTLLYCKGNDK